MTALGLAAVVAAVGGSLPGCGDEESTPPGRPGASAAPAARQPPAVPSRRVTFRATDGKRVRGVLRPAAAVPAPAVVLLHQVDGGAEQWDDFAPALHRAGFTTLAFDGRGGLDVHELAHEARGALGFLRRRDDVRRDRLSVVGASIGGATAVWLSTRLPEDDVAATVSLSPALDAALLDLQERGRYRPHDVLFIANAQESYAFEDLRRGARRSRVVVDPDGGHGVELLTSRRIAGTVIDWLRAAR